MEPLSMKTQPFSNREQSLIFVEENRKAMKPVFRSLPARETDLRRDLPKIPGECGIKHNAMKYLSCF
jgi:hypothetical protein